MTLLKSELLAAVCDRLSRPERWTKSSSARDALGSPINPESPEAVSWCVSGAIMCELRQRHYLADSRTHELCDEIAAVFQEQHPLIHPWFPEGVPGFNDDVAITHADVLSVLEKTHAKLLERGE